MLFRWPNVLDPIKIHPYLNSRIKVFLNRNNIFILFYVVIKLKFDSFSKIIIEYVMIYILWRFF